MSHKKNLLEAFTRSEAPGASSAGGRPGAVPPVEEAPLFAPQARGGASGSGPRPLIALGVIGVVVAFVLGFVTGRGSGGEALAAKEAAPPLDESNFPPLNQPRSFHERASPASTASRPEGAGAPASAGAEGGQRLEDSALFDSANLHTVVVAAYSNSNEDLAWATYEHLRDEKLPVFPPVASGNLVVVLVGAAPTESALESTKAQVKRLQRKGQSAYADAYVARIDKLIPRSNTKGN